MGKQHKFTMPHSLVIITGIMIAAAVLTWVIPAGIFERAENSAGVTVILPETFHFVASNHISLFSLPRYMVEGYSGSIDLILMILFPAARLRSLPPAAPCRA